MFMKCGKSNRAVFLNFIGLQQPLYILFVISLFTFSSNAQKTVHPEYVIKKVGLQHLLPLSILDKPQKTLDRVAFLNDSLDLSPKDYKWHCLEWFRLKYSVENLDNVRDVDLWKAAMDRSITFENSYIHRLFRFSYGECLVFGNVTDGTEIELSTFLETIELANDQNDHQMVFDGYILVADIYIDLVKRTYALKWLNRAKKVLPFINDNANKSLLYTFLADAQNPEKHDTSGLLKWKSEKHKKKARNDAKKGIHFGELATTEGQGKFIQLHLSYCILSDFTDDIRESLKYDKRALISGYVLKIPMVDAQYQSRISGVYLRLNSLDTAKMYLDSAALIMNQPDAGTFFNYRVLRKYVEYYSALNNKDSLIKYLRLYHESSLALNRDQAAVDLNLNESMFEDEKQKATIREQKLILTQEKSRSQWYTASFVISLLFVLLMLFILLRFRKQKREVEKKNSEIKNANTQLENLLDENKVLLNETHHRVKNNLQVISSLLESQVDVAENKAVEDAIRNAQSRIGTMAYVHDLLYKQDDHSNLEIGPYLKSLAKQVAQFHRDEDNLLVEVSSSNIRYPLHRAVHMGIFVNELLTNAHKHAREGKKQLLIQINLREEENSYVLTFKDNGPGLPNGLDTERKGSIGMYLLRSMTRQLRGKLTYRMDGGSVFTLTSKK
ncbi:MAG: hypothetical protein COA38_10605 [Fluviicola sp.]|nr:MAG: hypothetical protein COA38_10605 [Fluviicola sp.]